MSRAVANTPSASNSQNSPSSAVPDANVQWAPGLRAGDREVFRQLVSELWGTVTRVASQCLGDWSAAQDVAQRTFLRVWENRLTVEGANGRVARFCICIARRMAIDELRRQARAPLNSADPEAGHPGVNANPETHVLAGELWDHVDGLPDNERDVVILRYACGWTLAEVAGRTGLPQGTVSTLQRRALGRLRVRYGVTAAIMASVFGAGASSAGAAPLTTIPAIGSVIPAQTVASSSGATAAIGGTAASASTAAAAGWTLGLTIPAGTLVATVTGALVLTLSAVWWTSTAPTQDMQPLAPVATPAAPVVPPAPVAERPSAPTRTDEGSTAPFGQGPALGSTARAANETAVDRGAPDYSGQPRSDAGGGHWSNDRRDPGDNPWARNSSSSQTDGTAAENDHPGLDAPVRSQSGR